MLLVGNTYRHIFKFSQEDVIAFSKLSGDTNPLHLDAAFAESTPFKKPIIHGALATSIFSKIMGTVFPGEGSIYLKQAVEYKRPMFVDIAYEAVFTIISIDPKKHIAEISTEIFDKTTGKKTTEGLATVKHEQKF